MYMWHISMYNYLFLLLLIGWGLMQYFSYIIFYFWNMHVTELLIQKVLWCFYFCENCDLAKIMIKFHILKYIFLCCAVKPVLCDLPREHSNRVTSGRWSLITGLINVKCALNTSYCLIEVVTKAGFAVLSINCVCRL